MGLAESEPMTFTVLKINSVRRYCLDKYVTKHKYGSWRKDQGDNENRQLLQYEIYYNPKRKLVNIRQNY